MPSAAVRIRRLEPHEVPLHRDLRLRALRDSPDSFAETVADAEARPPSYWEGLSRSVTTPGLHVMYLACRDNGVVGSIYGLRDPESSQAGRVGGLWVESAHRRKGTGSALLEAVISWARENDLQRLRLWAPSHSAAALMLYRRAGFAETGRHRSLPTNAGVGIVELERRAP